MTLPIQTLLPIHVVHVSLRFHEQTTLKSLHSPSLSAFIRYLADSPARFDELIKIDAPESGRCEYLIGDAYHFTLYGLNGSQDILAYLLHALQKLPFSAVKQDKKIPFRNNLTLDSLHDAFSGLPIKHITQLTPYTLYDLQHDCQQWQGVNYFRLQLLSPIRLLKTKTARGDSKGEARYCQQLSDLSGDLLSNRLHDYFAALTQKQGINVATRNQPAPLTLLPNSHVFWLNASYSDSEGKAHVMGGMMGELFISIPDPEQFDWSLWLLGQYTGFGQRSAFGFGRYVLENAAGEQQLERVSSSHSLLTSIGSSENPTVHPELVEGCTVTPQQTTTTIAQYGERDQQGLLLCITGDSCVLRTQEQHLQVERAQQSLYHIPWQQLHAVLLLGNHHITTPALQDAMEYNIPLHFASQTGKYQGVVWNGQAGAKGTALWLRQQQIFAHPQYALTLSQEIVSARLSNIAESLRRRNDTEYQQINALIDKLPAAKTLAELNGLEGMGARYYFAALKQQLPEEFGFNERNRQPPLDPFNALLSLGFSLLYSCLESVLRTDGLLPWQGFYHQPHGKHATLASDLIEPFRHLVERLALSLINRKQLKQGDFYITDQQACYLQKEARNFYLSQLMAKLEEKNAFELMHQQNLSLINFIEQGENFTAWRVR